MLGLAHRKGLPGLGRIQEHLSFFGRPGPAQQSLALLNVFAVVRNFFHQRMVGTARQSPSRPTGAHADARTTCNECRCRSDYFIRASRNFFALQSFFSRISQEVV
jgi:hypothetical protein